METFTIEKIICLPSDISYFYWERLQIYGFSLLSAQLFYFAVLCYYVYLGKIRKMPIPVINNPCPEKWQDMAPAEQGRFCGKCSKIVIDFTKKTTQEIIDFLNDRKGEDICGKLRKPVTVAIPVAVKMSSRMRLLTAALYFVFGAFLFTSCGSQPEEEPVGKVGIDSATQAQLKHEQDSIARADSMNKTGTTPKQDSNDLDSAEIINTMKVLDSIMKAKKK